MADDFDLVRRIVRGDDAAYEAMVREHGPYLYGVAHALCGHAADAEDLVQETFEGALRSRFRGEASLRTFLVQILVRRAAMLRRWRRRKGKAESLDAAPLFEPAGSPPASQVLAVDARLDLTAMLQTLSPEHRAVLILREREGLSYEQIAAALQVPRGTVESRLHRARAELRRQFSNYFE